MHKMHNTSSSSYQSLCIIKVNVKNNNSNNHNNINNNNNINKRAYPKLCSGQRALALIGWFERAVMLCGGTKAQK